MIWQPKMAPPRTRCRQTEGIVKLKPSVISLIGFCFLTATGAAFAFAILAAAGAIALADPQNIQPKNPQPNSSVTPGNSSIAKNDPLARIPQANDTFNGMITDSRCGARHMKRSRQNSAECASACVRKGASYVLVDGDSRYRLAGGGDSLSKLAGQRATVTGTRQGNTITVSSAAPLLLP
jgi:phage tail tape-measure protein